MILPAELPPAFSNGAITDRLFKYIAIFAISYHVATFSKDAVITENVVRSCRESDEKYESKVTLLDFPFTHIIKFYDTLSKPSRY